MGEYQYHKDDRNAAIRRRRELVMRMQQAKKRIDKKEEEEKNKIAPKLEIGNLNDKHEQEADAVAQKVVYGNGVNNVPALSSTTPNVQMKEEDGTLMAKSEDGTLHATDTLQTTLDSTKGTGQPLDEKTQSEMGTKMNADLGDVKIHTDSKAHEMSEGINAKAFTHGQDIYFKQGNFDTSTNQGKELLAHELAHTQQQSDGVERKIQRQDDPTKKTDQNNQGNQNSQENQNNAMSPVILPPSPFAGVYAPQNETKAKRYESLLGLAERASAPHEQEISPAQANMNQWDNDLDSADPAVRAKAIAGLDQSGPAGGWALLIVGSQKKQGDAQAEIKAKLKQWLKSRPDFKNYVIQLAAEHSSVLSDDATLLLSENGLGAFVNKAAFVTAIRAKFFLAKSEMTDVIGKNSISTALKFNMALASFEAGTAKGTKPLEKYSLTELTDIDRKLEDIFNQQRMIRSISNAVVPLRSDPAGKTPKSALSIAADKTWDSLLDCVILLSDVFNPEKAANGTLAADKLLTLQKDFMHDLALGSAGDLVGQISDTLGCVYELQKGFKAWDASQFYFDNMFVTNDTLNDFQSTLEGMMIVWNKVASTANENPAAYFSFMRTFTKDLAFIVPRVNAFAVALGIYNDRNVLANGKLKNFWDNTSIFDGQKERFDYHLKTYLTLNKFLATAIRAGISKNTNAPVSSEIKGITSSVDYIVAKKYTALYAESDATAMLIFNIVETVLLTLVTILTASLAAEVTVPAIAGLWGAGTGLIETAAVARTSMVAGMIINALYFTTLENLYTKPAMGQEPNWNNFGAEFTKNLILFGSLGAVSEGYGQVVAKGTSVGSKVAFQVGLGAVELTTLEAVDGVINNYLGFLVTEKEAKEVPFYEKLAMDAGMLLGIKLGMKAIEWPTTPPKLKPEFDTKFELFSARINKGLERLKTEDLTKAEEQQLQDDIIELNTLRAKMVRKAAETVEAKSPEEKEKLKKEYTTLADTIMARVAELKGNMRADFNVRLSPTNPKLSYFEGDPLAFRKSMLNEKGSMFTKVKGLEKLWQFTNAKGEKMFFMETQPGMEATVKLSTELTNGVSVEQARSEFWTKAGDASMANDAAGDEAVVKAIREGWKPNTNTEISENIKTTAEREGNREKRMALEKYFKDRTNKAITANDKAPAAEKQLKITPEEAQQITTLEMLPMETLELFMSNDVSAASMDAFAEALTKVKMERPAIEKIGKDAANQLLPTLKSGNAAGDLARIADLLPDLAGITGLDIQPEYVKWMVNGKEQHLRIDKANRIDNYDLADKVKNNPEAYKALDEILKSTDAGSRAALQQNINTLTLKGIERYIDLQGKVKGDQAALIDLAKTAVARGYDLETTINYSTANDVSGELGADKYTDLLDTKNSGRSKKASTLKYADEAKQIADANATLDNTEASAEQVAASRTQLETVKKKLDFELAVKDLADYLNGKTKKVKGNPFADYNANRLLQDAVESYLQKGGESVEEFTQKLVDEKVLGKRKAKDDAVQQSIEKAFEGRRQIEKLIVQFKPEVQDNIRKLTPNSQLKILTELTGDSASEKFVNDHPVVSKAFAAHKTDLTEADVTEINELLKDPQMPEKVKDWAERGMRLRNLLKESKRFENETVGKYVKGKKYVGFTTQVTLLVTNAGIKGGKPVEIVVDYLAVDEADNYIIIDAKFTTKSGDEFILENALTTNQQIVFDWLTNPKFAGEIKIEARANNEKLDLVHLKQGMEIDPDNLKIDVVPSAPNDASNRAETIHVK